MSVYISLLRGINVGNQKTIRMAELKAVYESLGFDHVSTYVQSGNVLFECADSSIAALTGAIESGIARRFGFPVPAILRERDTLQQIIEDNPFVNRRNEDPSKLHVTFLSEIPASPEILTVPSGTTDEYILHGQDVYLLCQNGYGKTRLSNGFFEKKLNVTATTRNWKTVLALYGIAMNSPYNKR